MNDLTVNHTYQVMPDLNADDYAALKADIKARGIMVPVEYDENGNILDGHHRVKAAKELHIAFWPRLVRKGMTEDGKRAHARALNYARRHLTSAQRRDLIASQLKDTPQQSDRQIASSLGVDHKTVSAARDELASTGEIPQLEKRVGADGKERKQPKPKPEKPKRTAYVSEYDAKLANRHLPDAERKAVLSGELTADEAINTERFRKQLATQASERIVTADCEPDPPAIEQKSNNVLAYEIQTALELLASEPVEPAKVHTIMPDYQWYRIEQNIDRAIVYLQELKTSWRTSS